MVAPPQDGADRPLGPDGKPTVAEIRALLDQPYRPLARGAKLFVHASADGRAVLKVPVAPEDMVAWFAGDGELARLTAWMPEARDPAEAARLLLARSMSSYRLAAARLWHETGLIDLHLDATDDRRLAVVLDGRRLDADRDAYILQWRARPLRACIDTAVAAGDVGAAERMLDDLIAFTLALWSRRIVDDTANFHTNYGYVGRRLILFDIGELVLSAARARAERAAPKLLRKKGMAWLERKHPSLAEYLARRLRECAAAPP